VVKRKRDARLVQGAGPECLGLQRHGHRTGGRILLAVNDQE
jgi:hypothetical protein